MRFPLGAPPEVIHVFARACCCRQNSIRPIGFVSTSCAAARYEMIPTSGHLRKRFFRGFWRKCSTPWLLNQRPAVLFGVTSSGAGMPRSQRFPSVFSGRRPSLVAEPAPGRAFRSHFQRRRKSPLCRPAEARAPPSTPTVGESTPLLLFEPRRKCSPNPAGRQEVGGAPLPFGRRRK